MMDQTAPFQVVKSFDNRIGVILKWRITKEAIKFIRNKHFDYLFLDAVEPHGMDDLDFLVDHKEKIREITIHNDEIDWEIINQLAHINVMKIGGWFDCRGLDFRKLKKLSYLETYWNNGYENVLCNLKNLRGLNIIGCKTESLNSFGNMPKLEYVSLFKSRTLKSLAGCEKFKRLKYLEMEACSNISDITALASCNKLQYLDITNCNRFNEGADIANIKNISHLALAGHFDTVAWLEKMKHLYSLRMDCKLDDGDLDFLYNMKNLKFILYKNKKNYTVKIKDIQRHLEEKGFDQEEVWDGHGLDFPDPKEFLT